MSLNVSVAQKELGVFVVTPVGRIDTITAPVLEKEIAGLLSRSPKFIIFDMGGVGSAKKHRSSVQS